MGVWHGYCMINLDTRDSLLILQLRYGTNFTKTEKSTEYLDVARDHRPFQPFMYVDQSMKI